MDGPGVEAEFVAVCLTAHIDIGMGVVTSRLFCRPMDVVGNVDCYFVCLLLSTSWFVLLRNDAVGVYSTSVL